MGRIETHSRKRILPLILILMFLIQNIGLVEKVESVTNERLLMNGKVSCLTNGSESLELIEGELGIYVYKDKDVQFFVQSGTKYFSASAILPMSEIDHVISRLQKAIQWVQISRKEKLEGDKELGSWKSPGARFPSLIASFSSQNAGVYTWVSLMLINPFDINDVCFSRIKGERIQELIDLLIKVPETHKLLIKQLKDKQNQKKKLDSKLID